ncbi:MAG: UDP-N-acetylmuramate dehydrogenase [Oscillospiraceae bacterium]|nr:UDP-N-acetylmuramate dehydrogenase [Oscillospiraceae bacterium]
MLWYESLDQKIQQYLPDLAVECDVPMQRHTSFRIGGPARRMAFPVNREQLVILLGLAQECGIKPFIMGKGTNLLVADEGLDTLVIKTEQMNAIRQLDDVTLEADAGISLARLAVFAQQNGLAGLEFAHGIPGSLGGAVFMNAGAYGGEMKQVVIEVAALFEDGVRYLTAEEAQFAYRHSVFSNADAVVLGAKLRLEKGDSAEIRARMDDLMARRKQSQPLEYPSAGSTFKRPTGYFAGTLIEQTGLKGLTVGGAQVSEKHAGFVINIGGATCADVTELIAQVQQRVLDAHGVQLEPEVKIIR